MSRRSLQLTLALVGWCWLGWFLLVSVGELIFDLFLTSSNNLTATVESNAATEKKNSSSSFRRNSVYSSSFFRRNSVYSSSSFRRNSVYSSSFFRRNSVYSSSFFRRNSVSSSSFFRRNSVYSSSSFRRNSVYSSSFSRRNSVYSSSFFRRNSVYSSSFFRRNSVYSSSSFNPIYREMLNSASRHRPSKSMELRRAASGLVKVICRTEESRPGGKGRKPGKPKKKGLLASFEDWFGSINMMNILYVWFPASWGPSVVEAIQKRNVTCLAKKPIVRDPHIFDRKEAARGSRA